MLRWDPFADMAQLREQVNRLFEQSLTRGGQEPAAAATWAPVVDIAEKEDALILLIEVPGVDANTIDIQLSGESLTIRGERKVVKDAGTQYLRIERSYGAFQRSFTLGVPVQQDKVRAAYRDGVLTVTLPKREEVKPKLVKIEVQGTDEAIEAK